MQCRQTWSSTYIFLCECFPSLACLIRLVILQVSVFLSCSYSYSYSFTTALLPSTFFLRVQRRELGTKIVDWIDVVVLRRKEDGRTGDEERTEGTGRRQGRGLLGCLGAWVLLGQ
ncbi:hypothetical protein VTL71DRAFT_12467 [Oculimacula yallundae]|uniref:Uncharacterized protein n=1 Tax=Oculimacula yallundae TaxID=86028 RepID=A0ABR4CN65_9HELO